MNIIEPELPFEAKRNAAKCLACGETIESTYRHDFVRCGCGQIAVDGGHDYGRWVGPPELFGEPDPPRAYRVEHQEVKVYFIRHVPTGDWLYGFRQRGEFHAWQTHRCPRPFVRLCDARAWISSRGRTAGDYEVYTRSTHLPMARPHREPSALQWEERRA